MGLNGILKNQKLLLLKDNKTDIEFECYNTIIDDKTLYDCTNSISTSINISKLGLSHSIKMLKLASIFLSHKVVFTCTVYTEALSDFHDVKFDLHWINIVPSLTDTIKISGYTKIVNM